MRLFIAIPLPKTVKQQLLELQQPVDGMRWQFPDQIHLTLKFVGDTPPKAAKELSNELQNIEHPAFAITISGIGYFPQGKAPKVVWAGVQEQQQLSELHQKVESKCQNIGVAPENRPYKPHVTIARTKNASKRVVTSFIDQHKKFVIPDISVREFVLYESKLHPDGAQHNRLQTYSLATND